MAQIAPQGVTSSRRRPPEKASRPLWQSGLFWRLLSGIVISGFATLLTAGLSLQVIESLVAATHNVQTAASNADRVAQFAVGLDYTYAALNLITTPDYQPRYYTLERQRLDAPVVELLVGDVGLPPGPARQLASIRDEFVALDSQLTQVNALASTDLIKARASWLQLPDNYAARFRELRQHTRALAQDLATQATEQTHQTLQIQETARVLIGAISAAGLVMGILIPLLGLRQIVQRVGSISQDLTNLANRDLRPPARLARLQPTRTTRITDEIQALEQDYLKTVQTLRAPFEQIQQDAVEISTTASSISAAAQQQAQQAGQQAVAITQIHTTVEELNQTAVQIAEAATSVASAAEQALVSAARGQDAVRDSVIGMAMIRSRVNDITARILALSAQSQRISEIIDVIDEMAARTHILALNAAVESAAAGGETGERFGVVAAEVKKLAQRSAAATREVRTVIAQVQAATNAAVMATEDGLKETEKGVQTAHQSGNANEDIIQMIERTVQLANAISLATQQQRSASEQVVSTIREIAAVIQQTASNSRQVAHDANDLTAIAQTLRTVTGDFRLAGADPGQTLELVAPHRPMDPALS